MSMPAIERVIPLVGHLPVSIRDALARRLRELAGLSLISLSSAAAAALMTWSVQDPSLSHATSRPIRNVLVSRRDRRRSPDADSRPRRDHADAPRRGVGLAHADPSHLRPRSAAPWMLDSLHRDRGRLCKLLAAWRSVGAADRPWRRRRRCAGARARRGVRPGRLHYRLVLGIILFAAMCAAFLFASGWGSRPREADADRGR